MTEPNENPDTPEPMTADGSDGIPQGDGADKPPAAEGDDPATDS